jgi:16S rRNA (uracil1498-N3)-methyltransferase
MANMKTDNKLDKGFVKSNNICLIIGPEGGFSDNEIIQALESNVKEITLGKNRLRTETAAIYFISAIKSLTN